MERRLILLDVDGTLVEPGGMSPPALALQAVRRARQRGHKVALCSGRNHRALGPLPGYGFDAVVSSAGARIACGGHVLYDCTLPPPLLQRALAALDAAGIVYTVEGRKASYQGPGFFQALDAWVDSGQNSELERWRRMARQEPPDPAVSELSGDGAYKIIFISPGRGCLAQACAALAGSGLQCCVMGRDGRGIINGEFIHRSFNKGMAVRRLAAYFGIPMARTCAFGDSMNDAAMLRAAALGICMGNGSAPLRRLADEVCPPQAEHGLYRAFARHGLM